MHWTITATVKFETELSFESRDIWNSYDVPENPAGMSFLRARIQRDIENLCVPVEFQIGENELFFRVRMETEIYSGMYDFRIDFPPDYPFKSPKLFCTTAVFHPNIDKEGRVCLKVLREGWMPCYDINSIIVSLICSFHYPSGKDALNVEAGDLLEQDYEKFVRIAKSISK